MLSKVFYIAPIEDCLGPLSDSCLDGWLAPTYRSLLVQQILDLLSKIPGLGSGGMEDADPQGC